MMKIEALYTITDRSIAATLWECSKFSWSQTPAPTVEGK